VVALLVHEGSDLAIEHEHQGSTSATQHVGAGTLEHGFHTLVLDDLVGTVDGTLVHALLDRELGLHLQTTTNSIEGIGDEARHDDRELSTHPLTGNATEPSLLVERIQALDGVVQAELGATVWDDTSHRDTETIVQREEALRALGSLRETVTEAVKGLLSGANIRSKTGTSVVKRVHEAEGHGASTATGSKVDNEELPEVGLGLYFGKAFLIASLEARLMAWVGKYRIQLVKLPRQKALTPCSAATRVKQFMMPV